VLVDSYTGEGHELWGVDPALGRPTLAAEHVTFLGTVHMLRHSSTEAGRHRMSLRALPPPGPSLTWVGQSLPDLGLRLSVPPAWRFDVQDVDAAWTDMWRDPVPSS
jgi:hypothetical protein